MLAVLGVLAVAGACDSEVSSGAEGPGHALDASAAEDSGSGGASGGTGGAGLVGGTGGATPTGGTAGVGATHGAAGAGGVSGGGAAGGTPASGGAGGAGGSSSAGAAGHLNSGGAGSAGTAGAADASGSAGAPSDASGSAGALSDASADGMHDADASAADAGPDATAPCFAEVTAGEFHTCGRKTDGTLWCWGRNEEGRLGDGTTKMRSSPVQVVAVGAAVAEAEAGGRHTCARKSDASLWCWGSNSRGQLGDGTTEDRAAPVEVAGVLAAAGKVAAGGVHTCASKTDGSLWCWGGNLWGQLGDGTNTHRSSPVPVLGLGTAVAEIGAGWAHSCARKTDGTVWCWGENTLGQLGDGTQTSSWSPVQVANLANAAQIAVGYWHSCARKTDGTLWCWGDNWMGALGDGTTTRHPAPVQVDVLGAAVASVAAGTWGDTCARKTDGTLWCWGSNGNAQLGDGTRYDRRLPVQVATLGAAVSAVAPGQFHTCALETDGDLWCWGSNEYGQLGNGASNIKASPLQLGSLGGQVAQVAAGLWHTCARKADATLWCWGDNWTGQLGDGTTTGRSSPVEVAALGAVVAEVAPGASHTCARKVDGTLWCWGSNVDGQLGDGSSGYEPVLLPVPVAALGPDVVEATAGQAHSCARKVDGTLWCWGSNARGQLGDGSGAGSPLPVAVTVLGGDVTGVAAGSWHTCATKADSTLWCWGSNQAGQLGTGTTVDSPSPVEITAIGAVLAEVAAGERGTCARKLDGSLWCWGAAVGTTTPTEVTSLGAGVAQVASGYDHTCAVASDSTLWCWGQGYDGRLGDGTTTWSRTLPGEVADLGTGVVEVAAGERHTCARKTDGTLWCWGYDDSGRVGVGSARADALTPAPAICP